MRIGFPRDECMLIDVVQARGLGKFCGQSYGVDKILENDKNLENLEKQSMKIDAHSAKSSSSRERDFRHRGPLP